MKTLGDKITYTQTPEKLLLNISGKGSKQQVTLLSIWLVLWTLCGIAVISQTIGQYTREEKLIMVVYLVFWLYFEYKIYHVLRWRKAGIEIIKIEGDKMTYSREISGKGKVRSFEAAQVRNLQPVDYSDQPFQKSFYSAYWSLGGEALSFTYLGVEVRFGMQVEEGHARQLKKLIDKTLERTATVE